MVSKYVKRCTISLAIREMEIKTTVKYHFTPNTITKTNKSSKQNNKHGQKQLSAKTGKTLNPHTLLVGLYNSAAAWETSLVVLQNVKCSYYII